ILMRAILPIPFFLAIWPLSNLTVTAQDRANGFQLPTDGSVRVLRPGQPFRPRREGEPKVRILKLILAYQRAVMIAQAFGGTASSSNPQGASSLPGPTFSGFLAALLPEGIEAIVGYEEDNSIYIVGSEEAIGEMIDRIRSLDV